ncbi:hypothetical protein HYPDE_26098 [Hyphomicrobium denitrificans 1NES1]|uniref:Uncharacterized protein n=1 Tax=Hyphomicrobium denitrificans 1NES1 TaxID=670307 RepID=N0B3Y0_9HYPH|nr:hypothetical protein HYPDE_26098 [Hyphomicrobium denitrificans 1NES1]
MRKAGKVANRFATVRRGLITERLSPFCTQLDAGHRSAEAVAAIYKCIVSGSSLPVNFGTLLRIV